MPTPDLSAAEAWLSQRSALERKRRGQWATPWWLVSHAVTHLQATVPPPADVLDPACGDGRWLVAASRAWPGARLRGVDTDPHAIEAARRTCQAAGVEAELHVADGLSERVQRADLVIGNPPYVRPQHLDRDMAAALWQRFEAATDKADLYACFVEQGLRLAPRAAWVLPAPWLSLSSFAALRRLLADSGVDGVYALPAGTFAARVDAVLLVVGPDDRRRAGRVTPDAGVVTTDRLHVGPDTWSLDGPPPDLPGRPLGEHATVHMGVVCGDYARYVHPGRVHPEDRPTCRGRDVQRWTIRATDEHLRYLPRDMLDRKPYVAPKHAGLFDVPHKIVVAGTTGTTLTAALDVDRRFPLDSCYVVHPRAGVPIHALLGLLLCEPVRAWYGARYRAPRVKGVELARIPLPDSDWSELDEAARARDEAAVDAAARAAYGISGSA